MASKREVIIPYVPRNWAQKLHSAIVRWIVLVIHRRGGKTTGAINHLIRDCMNKKRTRYAYVAPTFKQAKRIVWGMAKFYTHTIPNIKYNEGELLITFPNGSELMIVGSDNPDSLRGLALWGAFLDEYPQQSPIIFTEIITKCLADHQGYCIFGGTPKGKGHFYRVFQVAQNDPEWCLVYKTIDDSLKEESGKVIDNLRISLNDDRKLVKSGIMTQDEFDQEWYNSFEASVKGAIYREAIALARKQKRITQIVPHDPHLLVHTVWDLGISKGNNMSIGFFQRGAGQTRMIGYYENIGEGLPHYIQYVKDRAREEKWIMGKNFAPHDIKVRELGNGKTRYDTAEKLNFKFELDEKGRSAVPRVSIEDGIDMAQAFFKRIFICSEQCLLFLDLIGGYHRKYDEGRNIFLEPVHDFTSNAADMFRYAALVEDMFSNEIEEEKPKIPQYDSSDEYMGNEDPGEHERHPMLKGVDLGRMGHPPPPGE